MTVNFGNLILSPDPTNPIVLAWDPDDPAKRQTRVKMTLGDATRSRGEVEFKVYLLHDPAPDRAAFKTITLPVIMPTSLEMEWDGTDDSGQVVERGVYAYDLRAWNESAAQEGGGAPLGGMEGGAGASLMKANRALKGRKLSGTGDPAGDRDQKTSDYLFIDCGTDEQGNPVTEAEFAGYDNNGTPEDETDDAYLYYIRRYKLREALVPLDNDGDGWENEDAVNGFDDDGDGAVDEDPEDYQPLRGASEGVIRLYYVDELEKKAEWAIPDLFCWEHGWEDGLRTSVEGLQHTVLLEVPVSLMAKAWDYRFVISVKDSHADREKGHRQKWALERNQRAQEYRAKTYGFIMPPPAFPPGSTHPYTRDAAEHLGSGGKFMAESSDINQGSNIRKKMAEAYVFYYFGHQQYPNGGALVFPFPDPINPMRHLYAEYRGVLPPDFNWHGRDAFLTAGEGFAPPPEDPDMLRPGALRRLGLAVFEGCNTANSDDTAGNLLDATLRLGAGCAVGWTRTLYGEKYHPGNGHSGATVDNDPAHLWSTQFWRVWCWSTHGDGSPFTLSEAHEDAIRYVEGNCYPPYLTDAQDPLGNMRSIVIRPDGANPTKNSVKGR
jgi:hypothetical protein